ncbi:gastrula zinc finger protein XlCGF26.1 [Austrofundulus limnaeus]|uniref:Gastrula zinc finger protein XlCGF26.1 n=1 Tax=Austrofundulus limnaeus TaxID=52670 RepID=A0A2I4BY28_AUSLI|nr:PREDICTED: gastrula zinc finger protein XlCGF26.1-like [Austrofundulus limnaeus]
MWKQQVKLRLEAAVEDILCIFERTVVNYEEELMRLQKNEPQNNSSGLRTSVLPANNQQKLLGNKHPSEELRPIVDQLDPEKLHIKEEEPWIDPEGEEIPGKKTETTRFPFTAALLKNEDEESIRLFSQLHQQQGEGRAPPSSSSAGHTMAATGGEDSRRAETTMNLAQEDDFSSSETEVSDEDEDDDYECRPDFQLKHSSDSGSKTDDSDVDCKESKPRRCSECRNQFLFNSSHSDVTSLSGTSLSTCVVKMEDIADLDRKVETKLKSFSCDSCGKKCTRKATRKTHRKALFTCYLCGWRFHSEIHLDKHMRVHKPFSCDICGYRFGHKSHLKSHLKIHSGVKPFACTVCELRFTRNTHLSRHMITHTGQKPFACDVCGKKFTRKEHLNRHMRKQGPKHSYPTHLKKKMSAVTESKAV